MGTKGHKSPVLHKKSGRLITRKGVGAIRMSIKKDKKKKKKEKNLGKTEREVVQS